MKKDKEISTTELAGMVADGFACMERRFESMDKKFGNRFDQMDKKIEDEIRSVKAEISLGIRELKEEIERLDIRIDRLLKQTDEDLSVIIEEQEKIKLRLKKLELKNSQV